MSLCRPKCHDDMYDSESNDSGTLKAVSRNSALFVLNLHRTDLIQGIQNTRIFIWFWVTDAMLIMSDITLPSFPSLVLRHDRLDLLQVGSDHLIDLERI